MKKTIFFIYLFLLFLLIILGYLLYFYYLNRKALEPFCNDCRVKPDVGSKKNINNFIISTNNQTGENNPPNLSQTILINRCSYVPIGAEDSSYIFCPFTNNCQLPIYSGTNYNINSTTNKICSIDNSCCNTDFHNNNYYTDNKGIKHFGLIFEVGIDKTINYYESTSETVGFNPYLNNSTTNEIDFSYNIMKYTPVTAEKSGYLPNILGKHYKTTIKNSQPLIIKSNTNNYIDCYGNLQNYKSTLLPSSTNTSLFTTPGELWCLQSENQQYCKKNRNYILTPNTDFNNTNDINYSNNSAFSQNLITPGSLPNTVSNPYPSTSQFSSDNIKPTTIIKDWLQTHLQPTGGQPSWKRKNYQADPKF